MNEQSWRSQIPPDYYHYGHLSTPRFAVRKSATGEYSDPFKWCYADPETIRVQQEFGQDQLFELLDSSETWEYQKVLVREFRRTFDLETRYGVTVVVYKEVVQ